MARHSIKPRRIIRLALAAHAFAVPLVLGLWFLPGGAGETARAGHRDSACKDCHLLVATVDGDLAPVPDFEMQCRSCHPDMAALDRQRNLTFHGDPNRPCLDCHSYHHSERMVAADREFTMTFGNPQRHAACASCHGRQVDQARLSEGHRAAATLYHSDFRFSAGLTASQTCLLCHGAGSSVSRDLVTAPTSIPKFSEHAMHPIGVPVKAGSGEPGNRIRDSIDPRIQLVAGRIECQSCHDLSSPYLSRVAGFASRDDLCRGCHDVN